MADALVSIALEKLTGVVGQQLSLFVGATRELQMLSSTFQSIQAVIADAENRQVSDKNVKQWLSRLRHVAFDIADLLDEWVLENDEDGGGDDGNRVCAAECLLSPYRCLDQIRSRHKIAHKIKDIKVMLNELAAERHRLNVSAIMGVDGEGRPVRSRTMTSSHMKEEMIGRDHDRDVVISRLVSGNSSGDDGQQLQVIAIVGAGGLGKTTLAGKIYHDSKVRFHFKDNLYWVCDAEDFNLKRLTKAIIEQVKGPSTNSLCELNTLGNELVRALRGKRFLLVLDDVWNQDKEKWDTLELGLASGAPGSRILVTTRIHNAAKNAMNAAYIHKLKGLSYDHSWMLFRRIAFDGSTTKEYSQLESVGREIVSKCKGLPLSIVVMGSVMNLKRTVEDWQNILDSEMWSSTAAENEILPALWLSYQNLPPQLKQCFAYCSMFPKGWVYKKDMLVKLWVAQGFFLSARNREVEDVGEDYFDALVAWSMFQQQVEDGETKYIMHDLLNDLARFTAEDEIYTFVSSEGESAQFHGSNVRHAFLNFPDTDDMPKNIPIAIPGATNLKTLLVDGVVDGTDNSIVDLFSAAKSLTALILSGTKMVKLPNVIWEMKGLRYLDLSRALLEELPNAIGQIKQLRYLDLSWLNIVELPKSVTNLHNLRTLNLTGCLKLKRLPRDTGGMVSLRHLEIEKTDSLEYLPKHIGRITCLRSLCKFIVGGEGGCGIDELKQLNSLQGILRIQHLERVSSREDARKAQLWNKKYLRSLVLSMLGRDDDAETKRMDDVLEGLWPHENLEELKLFWYTGSKLPSWMKVMPYLRKLELCGCPKLEGQLHHLDGASPIRELMIRDCHRIKGISGSSFVFLEKISVIDSSEFFSTGLPNLSNLKTLEIRRFRNETLPDEGWERLVALQTLEIWNCDELKSLPDGLAQTLESLIIFGCDQLESLPEGLGQFKKLKALTIGVLEALKCLPESLGQLESLEHLEISSCDKLEWLPDGLGHLKKLKLLRIQGLQTLSCLPDSLGLLESLEHLNISGLEKLESVPDSLGELKALNHLDICLCGALRSLPHGLQHLYLLQQLYISGCPLLSERCLREEGDDWPKIRHIPCITIDDQRIQ